MTAVVAASVAAYIFLLPRVSVFSVSLSYNVSPLIYTISFPSSSSFALLVRFDRLTATAASFIGERIAQYSSLGGFSFSVVAVWCSFGGGNGGEMARKMQIDHCRRRRRRSEMNSAAQTWNINNFWQRRRRRKRRRGFEAAAAAAADGRPSDLICRRGKKK